MTTAIQRRDRVIDVFNDCLQAETSNTLDTYWNRYEYVPAFTSAIGVTLPDPSEFQAAVNNVLEAVGDVTALREATIALWSLVYGTHDNAGQPATEGCS